MTKKDYVLIAAALKEALAVASDAKEGDATYGAVAAASLLANRLQSTNPRFDKARFLNAAGVSA